MKKTIIPSKLSITLRPEGGACLSVSAPGGDIGLELPRALWNRLGEDARWFAAQTEEGLPGPPALFDHEALISRVERLEQAMKALPVASSNVSPPTNGKHE